MADQSHVWRSSLSTVIHEVASRPHRSVDRTYLQDGRGCLVLVATVAVAVNAWALFPSPDKSGGYDDTLASVLSPAAADVNPARATVVVDPLDVSRVKAFRPASATMVTSNSTWQGPVQYSTPAVVITTVSVRSKLETLLMLLYSESGDVDPAALEAKIQALLKLPDPMLAQLMAHPDLAMLNEMLDAVFLGTADVAAVKTELDKIDVTSVPGTSEQIQVISVGNDLAYAVRSRAGDSGVESSAVSLVSAPQSAGEAATPPAQFDALAGMALSAFGLAPTSAPPPPPPPPPPEPEPEQLFTAARMVAPTSEEFAPPPMAPTSEAPTSEAPKPTESPTHTPQTSLDVMDSGNKFEPGETLTQQTVENSPEISSPATESATPSTPSTPATGTENPTEPGGGGATPPSNGDDGSGTTSEGSETP